MPFYIRAPSGISGPAGSPRVALPNDGAGLQPAVELGAVIRSLFRRLDPALWRECGYNPVLMLGRVSQADAGKGRAPIRATWRCTAAPASVTTPACAGPAPPPDGKLIAYFSAEYGLTECLPDLLRRPGHPLRRPSEVVERPGLSAGRRRPALPAGLFPAVPQSRRLAAGALSRSTISTPCRLQPVKDAEGQRSQGHGQAAHRRGRRSRSGSWTWAASRSTCWTPTSRRTSLPQDRDITDSLYGGDIDTRIRQEIVLGIGGMRALQGHGPRAHRLPHERGPLRVPGAGADPAADARREADASRRRWKRRAPATSSPPTRRCRPASTCSTPA